MIVYTLKGVNSVVNKLLGIQLFLLFVIHFVGLFAYWPSPYLKYFLGYDYVAGFAYAVVTYLYIRSMLGKELSFNRTLYKHLIVTAFVLMFFTVVHFLPNTLNMLVYEYQHFTGWIFRIVDGTMFAHTSAYAIIIFLEYRREKRKKIKTKNEIYRIRTAGFYFLLIASMSFTISLMGLFANGAVLAKYSPFITILFFFVIVHNSLKTSTQILNLNNDSDVIEPDSTVNNDAQKLKAFIENEKIYLNKNLTLDELACKMAWTRHHVSYVINNGLKMSFFELINVYRVKESLRIISDPDKKNLKIDYISEMSGFNSRATFYKAFKNHTGKTPSEYRRFWP